MSFFRRIFVALAFVVAATHAHAGLVTFDVIYTGNNGGIAEGTMTIDDSVLTNGISVGGDAAAIGISTFSLAVTPFDGPVFTATQSTINTFFLNMTAAVSPGANLVGQAGFGGLTFLSSKILPTGNDNFEPKGSGGEIFTLVSAEPVTLIPVPAALPLMLAGLGGLMVLRRRTT